MNWIPLKRGNIKDLILIACAGLFLRIAIYSAYSTLPGNDTPGYVQLATAIRNMDVHLHDGYRTPGYPLFMLALGMDFEAIRIVQHALGIATALLVYLLCQMRAKRILALAAGLLYALSIHFVFYEAIIQTEALSNFLVALVFYLFALRMERMDFSMAGAAWIAFLCAFLSMVRPQYLPVLPLLVAFDALRIWRLSTKKFRHWLNWTPGIGILATCVGGWMLANKILFGHLFLTLFSALAFMTHTIRFADAADGEFQDIGRIMVNCRNRAAEKDPMGYGEGAITYAANEIYGKYALANPVQLYKLISRINRHLVQRAPVRYASSVLLGCANFWRVSLIMYEECFHNPNHHALFSRVWRPNKLAWLAVHAVFFLCLPACLLWRKAALRDYALMASLSQVVIGGMLFQALLSRANSSRYALSSEALVLVAIAFLVSLRKSAGSTDPSLSHAPRKES